MPATMIDSHCHLNFHRYADDLDAVIQHAAEQGVTRVIIPAIDLSTTREAIALAEQYDGIFAAAGMHPNSTADFDDEVLATIRALAQHERIVSIGEIGLDYHWDKSPRETQIHAFEKQLSLAEELDLPVIIHNREASHDVVPILEAWTNGLSGPLKDHPGVLHSFSAPQEAADRALAAGFYLGFTGPITFKNADELRDVARTVPLNRLLVETDGPFLTPEPHRGKRNEPAYIPYIVDRLAGLHRLPNDEIARHTTANTMRLFRLPEEQKESQQC